MIILTKFQRPMNAELVWRLEDGSFVDANADSLQEAGFINAADTYMLLRDKLTDAYEQAGLLPDRSDLTDCETNAFRYLFEVATRFPSHFEEFKDEMDKTLEEAIAIERKLRGTPPV